MSRTAADLIALAKRVGLTSRPRVKPNLGHVELTMGLEVDAESPEDGAFEVRVRMNRRLSECFSLVLLYRDAEGAIVTLLRVNGSHGGHTNPDGIRIDGPHVHALGPDDINAGARPDARAKWAFPVDVIHNRIDFAWVLFRQLASIQSTTGIDSKIGKMQTEGAQLALPESNDADE